MSKYCHFFRNCIIIASIAIAYDVKAQLNFPALHNNWQIENTGSIFFDVGAHAAYTDHIEMSGTRSSLWIKYSVDSAKHLQLSRTVVFPSFRLRPNDTHASLMYTFRDDDLPRFFIDGKPLHSDIINGVFYTGLEEKVTGIRQNGVMEIYSTLTVTTGKKTVLIAVTRQLFPDISRPAAVEIISFKNLSPGAVPVSMEFLQHMIKTDSTVSYPAPHYVFTNTINAGSRLLQPGSTVQYGICYQASEESLITLWDVENELTARRRRVNDFGQSLQLETPDSVLNTAFEFAKRRIGESVFITKAGPMMCPGGLRYYAAIWANDEAEYANPFYPFTGDGLGNAAAINTYGMFAKYTNPGYTPLPSSIIAEGEGTWAGAGDRGDAAMIAYGASRFALAFGNADTARKLWPLIEWCLEFCKRKLTAEGVVASDKDELEGRFPAGNANLSTSTLYYDALLSAAALSKSLQLPAAQINGYTGSAKTLRMAIEKYFGADMKGFATYKYYKENTLLRSWICIPLTMGIFDRKQGTIDALFSPALFTQEGFLTQEGSNTFWDRSTLYALRGLFAAGETGKALAYFHYYSQRRLLGNHVPYPVEAYPEGDQRHLAAESALYCRVVTEGMFGIRPTGFTSFACTPQLPDGWKNMSLKNIQAFNHIFDILVKIKNKKLQVDVADINGNRKKFVINKG
ncbi:MAG TPA: hypothetical protein VK645_06040, partial [Chitinophagaceae bacterium]|nr:hypothetical protein [Chitinophagaceae bacterium]